MWSTALGVTDSTAGVWGCPAGARRERNNNKHKRLFTGEPGALEDGQNLYYKTGADGTLLRSGTAVINPNGVSGIRCDCCNQVGDWADQGPGMQHLLAATFYISCQASQAVLLGSLLAVYSTAADRACLRHCLCWCTGCKLQSV